VKREEMTCGTCLYRADLVIDGTVQCWRDHHAIAHGYTRETTGHCGEGKWEDENGNTRDWGDWEDERDLDAASENG